MLNFVRIPWMLLRRYTRTLGVRVTLFAVLAVAVAGAGWLLAPFLPGTLMQIGPEAVMPILNILASSMLAVSTFSLGVMVSAQNAASNRTTPRIHRLMLEDTTTQSVLAIFVGAFVYALSAIILFRAGLYPREATVFVMAVTILVAVLVVLSMLRWIDHLSHLGSLDDSLRIATERARSSLMDLAHRPARGAVPLTRDTILPETLTEIPAPESGYVQIVDVASVEACLEGVSRAYIVRAPGRRVLKGQPIALVSGSLREEVSNRIASYFVIGQIRTSEQDPEFGLTTLSETASKALSPGVNDPGTAIEAIERLETLLWEYAAASGQAEAPRYTRVFLPVPDAERLVNAAFGATARDGAGTIEVAMELRKALIALSASPDDQINAAANAMAELATMHSDAALRLDAERERLRNVTRAITAPTSSLNGD